MTLTAETLGKSYYLKMKKKTFVFELLLLLFFRSNISILNPKYWSYNYFSTSQCDINENLLPFYYRFQLRTIHKPNMDIVATMYGMGFGKKNKYF